MVKIQYQTIVRINVDCQNATGEIQHLIKVSNSTAAHMVIGSRSRSSETTLQACGTCGFVMRAISMSALAAENTCITDSTSDFRLISSPLVREFSLQLANNYPVDTHESAIYAGCSSFPVIEMLASLKPKEFGESTASTGATFKFTFK